MARNEYEKQPVLRWTRELSAQACAEGWDLFDDVDYGVQIQRLDDPSSIEGLGFTEPRFESDDFAIECVRNNAKQGMILHEIAIAFHDSNLENRR